VQGVAGSNPVHPTYILINFYLKPAKSMICGLCNFYTLPHFTPSLII
jgi:hypothetical protein